MNRITALRNKDFIEQCDRVHLESVIRLEDLSVAQIVGRALKRSPKRYYVEPERAVEILNMMLSSRKPVKVSGMNHRQMMYYELLTRLKRMGAIRNGRVRRPWVFYLVEKCRPSWFFMSLDYGITLYNDQFRSDSESDVRDKNQDEL